MLQNLLSAAVVIGTLRVSLEKRVVLYPMSPIFSVLQELHALEGYFTGQSQQMSSV